MSRPVWFAGALSARLILLSFAACAAARPAVPAASAELGRERDVDALLRVPRASQAKLTIVFVLDGLRPDAITPEDTPNLHALRAGGVSFPASHSVFPTVTRANAAAIATGRYPAANGIIGNVIYAPEVDRQAPISTGEYAKLRALDAASGRRLLLSASLGELLARQGKRLAVVSSSGNGCALLLNHRAPEGTGVLINGYLEPGKLVAFPGSVNDAVIARFGHTPARDDTSGAAVDWAQRVLREYVLPELEAHVIISWLTQPDGAQHAHGARSPEALAVIRNDDRNIGLVLDKLRELGLYEQTNVFVLSHHGFSANDYVANVAAELVKAGLKQSAASTDVVVAGNAVYVPNHDREHVQRIAEFLQTQPWIEAVFTLPRGAGDPLGFAPGTFSLALVHQDHATRGADILVSFAWSSTPNRHGARGVEAREAYHDEASGPEDGVKSGHGNLSPWDVRNTWVAWGVDFKDGLASPLPVANVDLLPTLLALHGISAPQLDGRVLAEAIEGGPDAEKIPLRVETHVTHNAKTGYRGALQVTQLGAYRYIDKSFRLAVPR